MRISNSLTIAAAAMVSFAALQTKAAERLGARAGPAPFLQTSPEAAPEGWIRRTQLVWIEEDATLERRTYEMWRSAAEAGLTFTWHPADIQSDQVGRVSGQGRVVWRRIDAADYDPKGIIATYEGALEDGLPHGQGVYSRQNGLVYRGAWRRGLMHGAGEISLPNGDHYKGPFRNGAPHGDGAYVDAEGVIYQGGFANGLRDGDGLVRRPDDLVYKATWRAGAELAETREEVTTPDLRYAALEDEVVVRVTVENLYNATEQNYLGVSGDISTFRTSADGDVLTVRPGSPRVLDVWKGRAPIHLKHIEETQRGGGGGFLGIKPIDLKPASLVFEFENRSRDDMKIVGAYLDVAKSIGDRAPMLQVSRGMDLDCGGVRPHFDPAFRLENYGWGPVETGNLSLQIVDERGSPFEAPYDFDISGLDGVNEVSLVRQLRALGVNPDRIQRGFDCSNLANANDRTDEGQPTPALKRACAAVLADSGAFGRLAPAIEIADERAFANILGSMRYAWRDHKGQSRNRTASFKTRLSLGEIVFNLAECGEGGEPEDLADKPYKFQLDRENYRIRVGLRDTVPAGVSARWRIRLDADKNSTNQFRMVFNLADGRRIASRPIDLMLIRPRFFE